VCKTVCGLGDPNPPRRRDVGSGHSIGCRLDARVYRTKGGGGAACDKRCVQAIRFYACMKALVALLVAFVLIWTSLGAMLAFNLWGAADRVSRLKLDRTIYRRNNSPQAWRAGGIVVAALGLLVLALIAIEAR
jgi:hypothetical protein